MTILATASGSHKKYKVNHIPKNNLILTTQTITKLSEEKKVEILQFKAELRRLIFVTFFLFERMTAHSAGNISTLNFKICKSLYRDVNKRTDL